MVGHNVYKKGQCNPYGVPKSMIIGVWMCWSEKYMKNALKV